MATAELSTGRTPDQPPGIATQLLLRAVRFYTFNTPIPKGKYRLYQTILRSLKSRPTSLPTTLRDGRRLIVDLTTGMQETVYFIGEYERFITEIAEQLIAPGYVCLDVGANFGWYTTLMSLRSGPEGSVHSFEPMPKTFAELERNREVAPFPDRIFINQCALGDRVDTVSINMFDDLPSGHASLSAKGAENVSSFDCEMLPLDDYLAKNGVGDVAFVKADIEGAELMFLRGAESLFRQSKPPIFLMEMALAQTKNFGYTPNDLIGFMRERADYDFYRIDEENERLVRIEGFEPDDIGANVFCVPRAADASVRRVIDAYLAD